jgi:hypothetical protein
VASVPDAVRNRALQRGLAGLAEMRHDRAEALYYELAAWQVHGRNARRKVVETYYEPVLGTSPFPK